MVFQILLIAGSFFSLNLVEITNPVCKDVVECHNSEFKSCCMGVCNVWKNCNGSCASFTDCGVHELCVDNMCSLNSTRSFVMKLGHLRLKDYLICIGFVIGLFLFQLALPLLYIYRDKVGFCLKFKWIWNKESNEDDDDDEEEENEEELRLQTTNTRTRWPLFGFPRSVAAQYSRLSQLDESCSFESEMYVQSRDPSQNLIMVQQQVENVFGVPPPVYAIQRNAGEMSPDLVIVSDSMQDESCEFNNEQRAVDSDTNIDGSGAMHELENYEERELARAEQQFNLAMSIPPPYERAPYTQRDEINSPGNDLTDDLGVECSLKQLYKLPSYNSINKIPEGDEVSPPSYDEVSNE